MARQATIDQIKNRLELDNDGQTAVYLNDPLDNRYVVFQLSPSNTYKIFVLGSDGSYSEVNSKTPNPQEVLSASIELNDAAIKAWDGTFKDIVPAQGAGTIVFPKSLVVSLRTLAAYTNLNAGASLQINIGDNAFRFLNSTDDKVNLQNVLTTGDDEIWFVEPLTSSVSECAISNYENQPCKIGFGNPTNGHLTGGDPDAILKIEMEYSIKAV
jgi:hypothetical protein